MPLNYMNVQFALRISYLYHLHPSLQVEVVALIEPRNRFRICGPATGDPSLCHLTRYDNIRLLLPFAGYVSSLLYGYCENI